MTASEPGSPIRVLIVDDSEVARDLLTAIFTEAPDFVVVGTANDGAEGVARAAVLKPDLITMDLLMPVMNGYDAVERIMATDAAPILVVTSHREAETAFRCVSLGALDVIDKPTLEQAEDPAFTEDFLELARLLASTKVIRRPMRKRPPEVAPAAVVAAAPAGLRPASAARLVALACSTGGPQALGLLLPALPRDFRPAILVVQHLAAGFEGGLVTWLSATSALPVALAEDGGALVPGTVTVARPGRHVEVADDGAVRFLDAEPVAGHRPSARYLFQSAARAYGSRCAGVILTGMGDDGAEALGAIRRAGGLTLAQDEATSTIYGMPRVAAELGTAAEILPLDAVAARLAAWAR